MQQDPNYGSPREEPRLSRVPQGSGMSAQDERTWSMLAHLSVLVWPLTGSLPIAPLVIWLVYKDKSQRVAFHALQSLWYQVAWIVIFAVLGILGTIVGGILTVITLGLALFILIPLAIVIALVPFVHQCYAAYKVYQGVDYRYPVIADMLDSGRRFA